MAETNNSPAIAPALEESPDEATMEELLEGVPLHSPRNITNLLGNQPNSGKIILPDEIRVYCDNRQCQGVRRHVKQEEEYLSLRRYNFYFFVRYVCTNCTIADKVFALKTDWNLRTLTGICRKIYEEPAFGSPIPKGLYHIIGEENREHFLQARRAIARGLGIGAYTYYRRIVENAKFDLVGAVLEVAKGTNAPPTQIELIQKAQSETQFSKAMDMLRDVSAIPAVLLIDGHNPLLLLHDLLSEGIHQLTDRECLERAQEAEVILFEIADKMQTALSERRTVKSALNSILNRKKASGTSVSIP